MKKPFLRCTVTMATIITEASPAAASGVSSPSMSSTPEPISVRAAAQAFGTPGRTPIDSNHAAVPGIRPPPKILR